MRVGPHARSPSDLLRRWSCPQICAPALSGPRALNWPSIKLISPFPRPLSRRPRVAEGRPLLAAATDEDLQVPWTLKRAGQALATKPRYDIFRGMVLNHVVHHRAQLGVYLRMLDVPVPQMYGPTADEPMW